MPTFDLYNVDGKVVGSVEQPVIFQTPVDEKLIHRYYVWVRTMLRPTLAHTKTRGDVSGGGRKPWRQKGTGRARVGSSRSPIWRTGGIVFGPRSNENFETRMPRSERRKAFFSALASKATANQVVILEEWKIETPSTKSVVKTIANLKPAAEAKKVLHIHADFDKMLFASTNNLPTVSSKTVQNLNILDIMNHDVVIMTKDSLTSLEQHFTSVL